MARVLVTRPIEEARQTVLALEQRGHRALIDPMLEIVFRADPLPAGPFDVLIVTSGNALAALRQRREFEALAATPLVAVGRRTGAAARAMGFAEVETLGRDVTSLVAHVRERWREPRRALYLAGADRSGDLATDLAAFDHDVTLSVVYEAHQAVQFRPETASAFAAGAVDAVLHYSARTADAFIACAGGEAGMARLDVRHLCLSRKVAEVLRRAGAARVAFAARPEEDALLALI
ncbi:uroporphyrinogen III methyltransferase [Labrys miyagiensis]|uniref:Uroporphyrinogen-III synthase n=1 Tax=Labrys miyagiensis TaxID=346912 RepID=A0ABQ6CKU4_9HYPH|nr:uroporphyrinogen-III synthase [Labrys miyagiensis]GLS20908.1 uroporphyrinogen III methyltransferase [Labrys miyagiensis]